MSQSARIAGIIGHELRNPLAAAMTGAGLLAELLDATDPRHAVLEGVLADLGRVSGLLDAYLALARTGRPRKDAVELAALGARLAVRHGTKVSVRSADAVVRGDEALLDRALENLIENALAAGATRVCIAAEPCGSTVRITVDDDGPGVPAELRDRVFEPFVSGRSSTGLGLFIVAETVAAHGGTIRCEPRPRGSRFVLVLEAAALALSA